MRQKDSDAETIQHRDPLPIPLSNSSRLAAVKQFRELGRAVSGNKPRTLVRYIETALQPVESSYRMLGLTAEQAQEHSTRKKEMERRLLALGAAARAVLDVMPSGGASEPAEGELKPQALPSRADPFIAAVGALLPHSADTPRPRMRSLRTALEVFASLRPAPALPRKPYEHGAGSGLVRAVCLYVSEQPELTLTMTWREAEAEPDARGGKRGGATIRRGQHLQPADRTTELIVAAARIFGLPLDNSRLRTHLLNYAAELRRERQEPGESGDAGKPQPADNSNAKGPRLPKQGDLYGTSYDQKPTSPKASKRQSGA